MNRHAAALALCLAAVVAGCSSNRHGDITAGLAPSSPPVGALSTTPVEVNSPTTLLPLYQGATQSAAPTSAAAALDPIATDPEPILPATVDSADGRSVTVTDASRILPLWGNLSEVVFTLGLGSHVVGRDIAATFPEATDLPVVTHGHDVSAESVLSLRPTVVFAQSDTGPPEALQQIRAAGVPVVVVAAPETLNDVRSRIATIAAALGVPTVGQRLIARTDAEIDAVRASIPHDVKPPRVAFLYMRGSAGVYLLAGPGSGADSMIAAAGGIDAGTAIGLDRPFTPLTSEGLVAAAPDAILMTTTGLQSVGGIDGLVEIPGVAQTPAGRGRRIITVEDGLLYSFGARTADALGEIVAQLYATGS